MSSSPSNSTSHFTFAASATASISSRHFSAASNVIMSIFSLFPGCFKKALYNYRKSVNNELMFYGIVIIIFLAPFSALAMDADTALEKWHARHPVETPLPVAATVSPVTHRSPLCGNVPARYYGRQEPERWTDECKKK